MTSANRQEPAIFAFFRFLGLLWRVYTGYSRHECDLRRPGGCAARRPLEHRIALRWHHLPRPARAGAALTVTAIAYGLLVARTLTLAILAALAFAVLAYGTWRGVHAARNWHHRRTYVRPLEARLTHKIGIAPASVKVHRDGELIKGVEIEWPPHAEIGPPEKELALEAVTTRLAIESPDPDWSLKNRNRRVVYTQSPPPPFPVSWEGRIAAAITRAAFNELVFGIGKRDTIGTASYSESPHLGIPGGSGGGKSNLVALLVLQELMRGSLVFILDPKATSHAWAINLPNVIYCVEPHEIRMALTWIAAERKRRSRKAHTSAARDGIVRARPGQRVAVVCEELNVGMPEIKAEWVVFRAGDKSLPKESPAISGLRDVACAGRACDIHAWFVAQMFNVESTGVKDSAIRSQAGIKAMLRWDLDGWNMAVGKNIPMPPPVSIPGRIQLVTAGVVREVQVPYLHLDDEDHPEVHEQAVAWARQLATSKDVARIPVGPDGIPMQLWPPCVLGQAQLALTAGQGGGTPGTVPGSPPSLPPVTLSQAYAEGIYGDRKYEAVRKAIQRLEDRAPEPAERGSAGLPHKWAIEDHYAMAKEIERR